MAIENEDEIAESFDRKLALSWSDQGAATCIFSFSTSNEYSVARWKTRLSEVRLISLIYANSQTFTNLELFWTSRSLLRLQFHVDCGTSFTRLYLSGNPCRNSIQPGAFVGSAMEELWLDFNLLTHVESGTFLNMLNLIPLRLMSKIISVIENGPFGNLPRLKDHFGNNVCVSQRFKVSTSMEADIFPGMEACFDNFEDIVENKIL